MERVGEGREEREEMLEIVGKRVFFYNILRKAKNTNGER